MGVRVWAETNVGAVRKHNEDALVSRPDQGLFVVADGAGGHSAGDLASGRIAECLQATPLSTAPQEAIRELRQRMAEIHTDLKQEAARRGPDTIIASTVVILLIREGHFACFWAGDSRAYLLRDGVMEQITRDHSLVQELVDSGLITEDQAESHPQANVITRAVGADGDTLELDKVSGRLVTGDRFLLCSDGLCKTLDRATIAAILAGDGDRDIAHDFIETALARRVRDNVTAVVVEFTTDSVKSPSRSDLIPEG